MFTNLRFKNFKSWADTGEMRMAPITGFFGTNSSGKTAILQFILMLKQTIESSDRNRILHLGGDRYSYVDLGTTYDIVHNHQFPAQIEYSLGWVPHKDFHPFNQHIMKYLPHKNLPNLKLDYLEHYPRKLSLSSKFNITSDQISNIYLGYLFELSPNKWSEVAKELDTSVTPNIDMISVSSELQEFYNEFLKSVIDSTREFGDTLLFSLVMSSAIHYSKLFYIAPLREFPKRTYLWSGEQPQDVGKFGELTVAALLASRKTDPNIEISVAKALKNLGLIHSFRLQPIAENRRDYEILVQRSPNSPEVLITDVGFGVSQILPVLVLCYYVPIGSTVILEQPEIHLHPSVQANLADVFIDAIKTRNIQIIIESHSEHLLRRLQRRIAEEKDGFTNQDAALYFCDMTDDGISQLVPLELDTYGNINNYPQDFFGDEMGDLVAMTEAAMHRQMKH